ncbi:MAG TPA: hypothetical protein VGM91_20120 [Conexibacter sp.]|jgi:hypothetical protein
MSRAPRLYEYVGAGMAGWGRVAHRTVGLGLDRLRLEPGIVHVCAHLSDDDVPVVAGALYSGRHLWRNAEPTRPYFAVRNDLLLPGFLAGYPPGLPIALRRALFGLDIGHVMQSRVRCIPVRFSDRLRLIEALRARPEVVLAGALSAARVDAFRRRAARLQRPEPVTARDVLDGGYADLLWELVSPDELGGPTWETMWGEHMAQSGLEVRRLIRLVRGGGSLVLFPHGFPSPDGGIGALDPRVGRLLHHVRPVAIQPLGLAYDPLVRGRPRAFVASAPTLERPPRDGGERIVLDALRRATPLTCGLVVAHEVVAHGRVPSATIVRAAVDRALARADDEGRPVEPALAGRGTRDARVLEAIEAAHRLGPSNRLVQRSARTLAAAWEAA